MSAATAVPRLDPGNDAAVHPPVPRSGKRKMPEVRNLI
jgi:hypothetical protein